MSKCRRLSVFFFLVNISHYRAGIGWTKRRLRERLGYENALASPLSVHNIVSIWVFRRRLGKFRIAWVWVHFHLIPIDWSAQLPIFKLHIQFGCKNGLHSFFMRFYVFICFCVFCALRAVCQFAVVVGDQLFYFFGVCKENFSPYVSCQYIM